MGWDSRVAHPRQDRTVHLSEVSKAQLAVALNEQSARFKATRRQLEIATRALVAIVRDSEALRYEVGHCVLAGPALARVKTGMTLRMDGADGGDLILVVDQAPPTIEVPHIVVPAGVQ